MGLNKYGELIGDKAALGSSPTFFKPAAERKCEICRGSLGYTFKTCPICNDRRAYCSPACIEIHQRKEHYQRTFCAQCGGKLSQSYHRRDDKIDNAFGQNHLFCCDRCIYTFSLKYLCQGCECKLPARYMTDYRITSMKQMQAEFCNDYCLNKYQRKKFCYACGAILGNYYRYCTICGEDRCRFCDRICAYLHYLVNHR
jgi:hypothetical protein